MKRGDPVIGIFHIPPTYQKKRDSGEGEIHPSHAMDEFWRWGLSQQLNGSNFIIKRCSGCSHAHERAVNHSDGQFFDYLSIQLLKPCPVVVINPVNLED